MPDRISLLSFVGGEQGYFAALSSTSGTQALRSPGSTEARAASEQPFGEAGVTLNTLEGPVELAWSPAGPMLEFAIGEGAARVHGVAASAAGAGGPLSGPGVLWDLPAEGHAGMRTAWAATARGSLTVLIAVRPEDVREHGEEIVGAARMLPGAEPYGYVEPLLSTEYDGSGAHTRATLELWVDGDDHPPERGAGTRIGGGEYDSFNGDLHAARFAWSIDGSTAIGAYEILIP